MPVDARRDEPGLTEAPAPASPSPRKVLAARLFSLGLIPFAVFCALFVLVKAMFGAEVTKDVAWILTIALVMSILALFLLCSLVARAVMSYGIEKAVSKHPEEFGEGAIEGVAAPEGANNAETGGALVPLLTLGIPGSGTTAILLAALVLWGFKPGPLFIQESPTLFWGLVASMYGDWPYSAV